jgi:hypothetical protein
LVKPEREAGWSGRAWVRRKKIEIATEFEIAMGMYVNGDLKVPSGIVGI